MQIAILGRGVVGGGIVKLVEEAETPLLRKIKIKKILVHRDEQILDDQHTTDFVEIVNDPEISVVCECIGGVEPAHSYVKRALEAGKHVVTANKKMLAVYAGELFDLARRKGLVLAYEASVGGGIPWIDNIKHIQRLEPVTAFQGIFNGTSNYILSQMAEKDLDFAACLKEAQELGYAEKDPSDDIDGGDVCYKVCLSALTAFGKIADPRQVDQWGIRHLTKEDFAWAKANGRTIKLLGRGRQAGEKLSLQVLPVMLKKASLLAGVGLNFNALETDSASLGPATFVGQGAGSLPTAHAAVQDLLDLAEGKKGIVQSAEPGQLTDEEEQTFYLRTNRADFFQDVVAERISEKAFLTKKLTLAEISSLVKESGDPAAFLAGVADE